MFCIIASLEVEAVATGVGLAVECAMMKGISTLLMPFQVLFEIGG
jgi:hypothetical protein